VCNGDHKPTGKLYGRKMGKTPLEYLKIEMEEVFCTSADVSGSQIQVMVNYSSTPTRSSGSTPRKRTMAARMPRPPRDDLAE
jgi:hypothetical protein